MYHIQIDECEFKHFNSLYEAEEYQEKLELEEGNWYSIEILDDDEYQDALDECED